MKRLILILLFLLAFNGCATTNQVTDSTGATRVFTSAEQAQDTATKTVVTLGNVLVSAPSALKAAYANKQMSKEDYNKAVDVYNASLIAYRVLNKALQDAITNNQNPNEMQTYVSALTDYVSQSSLLTSLIGGK